MATSETITCPICIEEFQPDALVKLTRCPHFLCPPCHAEHLLCSNRCPQCREIIQPAEELLVESLSRLDVFLGRCISSLRRLKAGGTLRLEEGSESHRHLR